jgi:hypothetical protein
MLLGLFAWPSDGVVRSGRYFTTLEVTNEVVLVGTARLAWSEHPHACNALDSQGSEAEEERKEKYSSHYSVFFLCSGEIVGGVPDSAGNGLVL